jgi:ribonuclease R
MVFDDQGKIEKIVPESRNDAHRLIEECMLAANVCLRVPAGQEHPALYRVHEGPTPEKLAKLRDFLGEFGLQLGGEMSPRPVITPACWTASRSGRICSSCRP